MHILARTALASLVVLACGCARPYVGRDGMVTFPEKGTHGAAIVTNDGLEFHDRADVPQRVVTRDASEPWRAPIGFILPQSGRFTRASRPTLVALPRCGEACGEAQNAASGLAIALRPSDTRVPSWGGEVLVRIDVIAPAAEGTARFGENVALIVDGSGEDTVALADVALGQLAARDRITVIDARGPRVIVPMMPASHRSMARAAIAKRLEVRRGKLDLAAALKLASAGVGNAGTRRVVVFSDGQPEPLLPPAVDELRRMFQERIWVSAIGTQKTADAGTLSGIVAYGGGTSSADPDLTARSNAVRDAIPPAGLLEYQDVTLTFEGTPAPSHVLEASGGEVSWRLESGELALGNVHAGEARTEVVRVTVPAWVPGEKFAFTVTARTHDVLLKQERGFSAELPCVYDDDIERIANSRHGDVIAYASALATLKRLDAAFAGEGIARAGGLRRIAQMHAESMALLARDTKDFAIGEQADILRALLAASEE